MIDDQFNVENPLSPRPLHSPKIKFIIPTLDEATPIPFFLYFFLSSPFPSIFLSLIGALCDVEEGLPCGGGGGGRGGGHRPGVRRGRGFEVEVLQEEQG